MPRFARLVLLVGLFCASTSALQAASLSLSVANLNWNATIGGPISPAMLVGVLNSQAVSDPDLLAGWQLNLRLVPTGGATGTLKFNTPTLPTPAANYLLNGNSDGLLANIDAAGTTLSAFDDDGVAPLGVAVPASGKSLLSLTFSTPDNARGTFQLVALGPPNDFTRWGDASPADRYFTNVPQGSNNPVVLATITVVPEPASLTLCACAVVLLGAVGLRRRNKIA